MIGELPQSTIPALSVRDPYRVKVVQADTIDTDIPYAVAEIWDWAPDDPTPWVRRPTEDSLPAPRCVLFPGSTIPFSETDPVTDINLTEAADFSLDTKAVLAQLDSASAAPTLGCTVGTKAGSWGLTVGNTGFVVTGIVNSTAGEYVVYVRPAGSGGGATLDVVQAVADGTLGAIPVKLLTLKADLSLSPNFTQAANAVTCAYFKF